ncbi:hypothetical protein OKW21_002992 [Catalinimonas alkaloidigena]|nr:hypothetical protein [Catalinimonas alkaloidigena]
MMVLICEDKDKEMNYSQVKIFIFFALEFSRQKGIIKLIRLENS